MQLTLKTSLFQGLVSKALKGLSANTMVAITSFIAIEVKAGRLTLTTTDSVNYLRFEEDGQSGSDFYVCLHADQFGKLISKLDSEKVTLDLTQDANGNPLFLMVKAGSGSYKLPIPVNEDGGSIKYDMPIVTIADEEGTIQLSSIKSILEINKSAVLSLFISASKAPLMGYYCGEEAVTSDTTKIALTKIKLFQKPALLRARLMELLLLSDEENITYKRKGDKFTFSTTGMTISSTELEGVNEFPIDKSKQFLSMPFESNCAVNKKDISNLIDRLMLFVDMQDKNLVYVTFNHDGLYVSTKQSNGAEVVPLQNSENFQNFNICPDIQMLKAVIDSQSTDLIKFEYGHPSAVKVVGANSIHLLSLAADDRVQSTAPAATVAKVVEPAVAEVVAPTIVAEPMVEAVTVTEAVVAPVTPVVSTPIAAPTIPVQQTAVNIPTQNVAFATPTVEVEVAGPVA